MYDINFKIIKEDINRKIKAIIISIIALVIFGTILSIVYFQITDKNELVLKISIGILLIVVIDIINSIIKLYKACVSMKCAKKLSKNGTLLRNQKLCLDQSFLSLFLSPCIFYINEKGKLYRLRLRNSYNIIGKSSMDVLIDLKNPKIYYIDNKIITTEKYDNNKNLEKFSDKKYYPDYTVQYEKKNNCKNSIILLLLVIGVSIYLFITKDISYVRAISLTALLLSSIEFIKNIRLIVGYNKEINKRKNLSINGTLYNNIEYNHKERARGLILPIVKYKDKDLVGKEIPFKTERKKIDLLIDEKNPKDYIIEYDIITYRDKYKEKK